MKELSETNIERDPLAQFALWFKNANEADIKEPEAMILACALPDGTPSARTVLLKEFDKEGFTFFTNYRSRKAKVLELNPKVALVFLWTKLDRQVRVEGTASKVSAERSDNYFATRPCGSKIGAHASPQSETVANRAALEKLFTQAEERFKDSEVPRPEHWGGYCVRPTRIEFWQGRVNRLADRIVYDLEPSGSWHISRLAP